MARFLVKLRGGPAAQWNEVEASNIEDAAVSVFDQLVGRDDVTEHYVDVYDRSHMFKLQRRYDLKVVHARTTDAEAQSSVSESSGETE